MTYFEIILASLIAFIFILSLFKKTRGMLKEQIKNRPFLSYSLICLTVVAFAFLYFPLFFKYIALEVWDIPVTIYKDGTVEIVALADLGPIGDIFGSLNSFISSIALCAVAFSTWLQVKSLKESRQSNLDQLLLAKAVHDEQIKESKNAIFSSKFNSLLAFKSERLSQIKINLIEKDGDNLVDGITVLSRLGKVFLEEMHTKSDRITAFSYQEHIDFFTKVAEDNFREPINPIISYFYIYGDLVRLINSSDISSKDKDFYKSILRNSMFQEEQLVLFWFTAMFNVLAQSLKDSELFNQFYNERYIGFALKYHNRTHFYSENWKQIFDAFSQQTQP